MSESRRELTEDEERARVRAQPLYTNVSLQAPAYDVGWFAAREFYAERVVPVSSDEGPPSVAEREAWMRLHPLALPVVEAEDRWADDEWHTDGDGNVIGGAPPNFVFVAKSSVVEASEEQAESRPVGVGKDGSQGGSADEASTEQSREHVRDGDHHENVEAGSSPRVHPEAGAAQVVEASGEREAADAREWRFDRFGIIVGAHLSELAGLTVVPKPDAASTRVPDGPKAEPRSVLRMKAAQTGTCPICSQAFPTRVPDEAATTNHNDGGNDEAEAAGQEVHADEAVLPDRDASLGRAASGLLQQVGVRSEQNRYERCGASDVGGLDYDGVGAQRWAGEVVGVAYCPQHGLHGARDTCFECGKPCEQVPMVVASRVPSAPGATQELGLPEGELLYRCESCGGLMSSTSEPECGVCGETMYAVEWPPRFTAPSSSAPEQVERAALLEAEGELRRIATVVDDEDAKLLLASADRARAVLDAVSGPPEASGHCVLCGNPTTFKVLGQWLCLADQVTYREFVDGKETSGPPESDERLLQALRSADTLVMAANGALGRAKAKALSHPEVTDALRDVQARLAAISDVTLTALSACDPKLRDAAGPPTTEER